MLVANFADGADAAPSPTRSAAGPIAFEARLTPQPQTPCGGAGTPAPGSAAQGTATLRAHMEVPAAGIVPQVEAAGDLSSQVRDAGPDGGGLASPAGQKQHPASGVEKTDAAARPDARKQTASSVTAPPAAAPDAPLATAVRGTAIDEPAGAGNRPDAAAPRAAEAADRTADAPPAPEAPKPSTLAGGLQFAVGGGDQRVEVRVAERGGELHVAVRTPDQRLAGSLRDDLPSLTAKLESAGLRTETWHTGSSGSAGRERPLETASRTLSQNSQEQPGQDGRRQHDDPPPQRAKRPEDSSHPKPDRKDFQWLLTSLR